MGLEDLDNNGAGAAGGDFDLAGAGDTISADLFGTSGGDDNGGGTDDVNLDDNGTADPGTAADDPAAGTPSAKEGEGAAPSAAH